MSGIFDQATISQVQQANDIVDVISEHVSLRRKGQEMVGLCPFHDDHRPSLNVNAVKQIFKCFACGAGGSVLTFVQMRENLTFGQAVERLAERAGIKLKPAKITKEKAEQQPVGDPNQLAKVNAWAAKYFQENLYDPKHGKYARDYLAERQITPESIKTWQLGLAVDSQDALIAAAKAKNIPMKLLEQAGLVTGQNQACPERSRRDKFINRLMFPITDVTGRVIGFGGRTLAEASAKYINSPATALFDKSNSLYGLQQARHQIVSTGTAVIVEGYTDCIMAHQCGCTNVVATLGTSFTIGHGRVLRRYAKKAVLLFDSDAAGQEAANRALDVCLSQRIDIKLALVGEGKDPCDFLLANGKAQFERLVAEAIDVFQFKWDRLVVKFGSDDTLAGRRLAVEEFLQSIAASLWAGYMPPLDRGLVLNKLSKIVGLDSKQINAELCKRIGRLAKAEKNQQEKQKVQGPRSAVTQNIDYGQGLFATAQREVLEVLLNEPKLFELVKQKISVDHFDEPMLKQIAAILFEALNTDIKSPLKTIVARAESVGLGGAVVELAQAGEQKGNFESRLIGAVEVWQRCQAQKKNQLKVTKDQTEYLRCVSADAAKQNRHNLGMV
ncbi:MAG: DNA primase [Sedimentisphaerales bacterium]